MTIKKHSFNIQYRNDAQKNYHDSIKNNEITFGIGPAGVGKTFIAVGAATMLLETGKINRIIITRPVVESGGEKLGFLPGTLEEKINPYLIPIFDEFNNFITQAHFDHLFEKGHIEIVPLAYMRGRTFKDSVIVLDEAQNCHWEQLKMFVTRLGKGSKAIINGDPTQSDLTHEHKSDLLGFEGKLRGLNGIGTTEFASTDIVRNPIITAILERLK